MKAVSNDTLPKAKKFAGEKSQSQTVNFKDAERESHAFQRGFPDTTKQARHPHDLGAVSLSSGKVPPPPPHGPLSYHHRPTKEVATNSSAMEVIGGGGGGGGGGVKKSKAVGVAGVKKLPRNATGQAGGLNSFLRAPVLDDAASDAGSCNGGFFTHNIGQARPKR